MAVFATSPVFVPEIEDAPVTERVGADEPEIATPFTDDGVISPRERLIAGVVVEVATVPDIPFAVVTDTLVTVPLPPPPPPDAAISISISLFVGSSVIVTVTLVPSMIFILGRTNVVPVEFFLAFTTGGITAPILLYIIYVNKKTCTWIR